MLVDYEKGDWQDLQVKLAEASKSIRGKCKSNSMYSAQSRVAFVFIDDLLSQPAVVRVLARDPDGTSPQPDLGSQRLLREVLPDDTVSALGRRDRKVPLFTIYIDRTLTTRVFTNYTASPTASPVQTGITQLISTASGGLGKAGSSSKTSGGAQQSALEVKILNDLQVNPPATGRISAEFLKGTYDRTGISDQQFQEVADLYNAHWVQVRCVITRTDIPEALTWAQITATDTASVRGLLTAASVSDRIAHFLPNLSTANRVLKQNLERAFGIADSDARASYSDERKKVQPCLETPTDATNTTSDLSGVNSSKSERKEAKEPREVTSDSTPADRERCQSYLESALNTSLSDAEGDATKELELAHPHGTIDPVEANNLAMEHYNTALAVHSMYAGIVAGSAQLSPPPTVYSYGPLTRASFGLGAGAIVGKTLHFQAKITNGAVTNDPPSALTSVNLYLSPARYDETTLKAAKREYFKFVTGFIITPDPGLFVGFGCAVPLMRSLSINIGYAGMLASIPPHGSRVGDKAPATSPQLVTHRGLLGSTLLELGYSF